MINNLLTTIKKAEKNLWEYVFQNMPTEDTINKSMIYALVLVVDLQESRRKRKTERPIPNIVTANYKLVT